VNSETNQDRGTGSTGGAAKLAAHIFLTTGRTDAVLLYSAKFMYEWVQKNLLSPDNGLYWDKVLPDGSVDTNQWIYNQGIMIGASVMLHRAASAGRDGQFGDPAAYLAHAEDLATRTLAAFSTDPYLSGDRGTYSGRSIFNAIFWRNLLLLYAVNKNGSYLQQMQTYADHAWNDRAFHESRSGLFKDDPESSSYWLLDQAGMVQVYACLGWDARSYGKLT
jgi:predicted alpha-1,6-mannanase (GH76 family)